MPADPGDVAEFLVELSRDGASISAVKLARQALAAAHRYANIPDPTVTEGVKRVLARLKGSDPRDHRHPRGLTWRLMAAIEATAQLPRIHRDGTFETSEQARSRGLLDIALVAVMRDAMLRRGEASDLLWGSLKRASDGSGRLSIRRGKGDREESLYIGPPTVDALTSIRPRQVDPGACVFNLSPRQIARRVQAAAHAAGLDGVFTGDSPRLGMAEDLEALPGAVHLFYAFARRSQTASRASWG